ncbi:hypothetical protein, partial [Sphaerisporangium melleum]|uniref:hypothetical protein n=1 Tax=Sphaerisporangium melleum TaxID=321316 RepID=UPI003FD79779
MAVRDFLPRLAALLPVPAGTARLSGGASPLLAAAIGAAGAGSAAGGERGGGSRTAEPTPAAQAEAGEAAGGLGTKVETIESGATPAESTDEAPSRPSVRDRLVPPFQGSP